MFKHDGDTMFMCIGFPVNIETECLINVFDEIIP